MDGLSAGGTSVDAKSERTYTHTHGLPGGPLTRHSLTNKPKQAFIIVVV